MKINEEAWESKFKQLISYKNRFKKLPSRNEQFPKGVNIGEWCHKMRVKKRFLSRKMVTQLNRVGFVWDLESHNWTERYKEIVFFKKANKRLPTYVVGHSKNELKLSGWLAYQRKKFHEGSLEALQVSKLKRMGVLQKE